jgi:hypothetical protein
MYCRLLKPINADRFLKAIQKASSLKKNTILKEFKPKGKDNANEFYINIDRRLKIEISLSKYRTG